MESTSNACPAESELSRLLSGQAVWQDVTLLRHLLSGCAACWDWLERKASHLDPSALPSSEPLAMAVMSAAMAQGDAPAGRFRLMRPLHAADARKARRDVLAFCRLVLHEVLPASLQTAKVDSRISGLAELARTGDVLMQATTPHLLRAAQPLTTAEQRHDLQAISLTYRAVLTCWGSRFDPAESILETAYHQLTEGSGSFEPWITWHTAAAMRQRLVSLSAGSNRKKHLQIARSHLTTALELLPSEGAGLQRAELLHDMAQVELALDDPPAAVEHFQAAWQLITQHGGTGLYLASLVCLGQAQAAVAMAKAQPLASTRQDWARQAEAHLAEVRASGLIEPTEWSDAAQDITACLDEASYGTEPTSN